MKNTKYIFIILITGLILIKPIFALADEELQINFWYIKDMECVPCLENEDCNYNSLLTKYTSETVCLNHLLDLEQTSEDSGVTIRTTTYRPSRGLQNPISGASNVFDVIKKVIKWLVITVAPIYVIMILVGAYQILFSAGDPKKVLIGRNTIMYATIAYVIILLSWGLSSIVASLLQ
ncbi:MAG: pilin [Minisyncoccia bacterium]